MQETLFFMGPRLPPLVEQRCTTQREPISSPRCARLLICPADPAYFFERPSR
jgi:hypothetical protein